MCATIKQGNRTPPPRWWQYWSSGRRFKQPRFRSLCWLHLDGWFYSINWSADGSRLLKSALYDLADAFCDEQPVSEITRSSSDFVSNSTIDLSFTSRPADRVRDVKVEPGLPRSNPSLVNFRVRGSPGKLQAQFREIFQYYKADVTHLPPISPPSIVYQQFPRTWLVIPILMTSGIDSANFSLLVSGNVFLSEV